MYSVKYYIEHTRTCNFGTRTKPKNS